MRSFVARRALRRLVGAAPALPQVTPLAMPRRFAATTEFENPVDIENFTLNEEIVARHQEANRKWQDLGERMDEMRASKDYEGLVAATNEGMNLYREVGWQESPIQAEPMLLLERAQAYYNLNKFDEAHVTAEETLALLEKAEPRDEAHVASVKEFVAFATLKRGKAADAEEKFRALQQWIDTDAKTLPPMVSVAATNMQRTVTMGLGMTLEVQAAALTDGTERAKYGEALDMIVNCLDKHIEENDVMAVKQTLDCALRCFVGLNDGAQAIDTCRKYWSWCARHDDEEGQAHGEAKMEELCQQFKATNPLIEARAARAAQKAAEAKAAAEKEAAEKKAAEEAEGKTE